MLARYRLPLILLSYLLFLGVTEASARTTAYVKVVDENCVVAKVVKITDGDTYRTVIPLYPEPFRNLALRPNYIDAPEMNSRCEDPAMRLAEEALAREVTLFAERTLLGKPILVCGLELDSFGRGMGELYLFGEEKSLRQMLEDRSYVTPYKKGDDPWCNPELYKK